MSGEDQLVPVSSAGYPVGLRDLEDAPPLHVLGQLTSSSGVAIVGTRRCTRYGLDLAESFGRVLARSGWTTVSGLARGIDAAAHRGALGAKGHAVAVLGCGTDVCYPRENLPIYNRILDTGGAIVSEYSPGTPPARWRFPARNRLIAAMSVAIVVVEAGKTGGALITARVGAELGRQVFAVPGDVDRSASEGCNRLIRDGAHPVLGAEDLVEEISLILGPPLPGRTAGPIPEGGVELEALAELWEVSMSEALTKVGRLELEGRARRRHGMVYPE